MNLFKCVIIFIVYSVFIYMFLNLMNILYVNCSYLLFMFKGGMICLQGSNHFKKRQCAKQTYLIGGVEKVFKNYFRNCIAKTALQNYYMQDCSVNFLKSIIIIIILQQVSQVRLVKDFWYFSHQVALTAVSIFSKALSLSLSSNRLVK